MKRELNIRFGQARAAALATLIAVTTGCHEVTPVAAKAPTPVHVAEVALYSSSEGLRYSASILPFAQANLSFKSAGYVTAIKQVVGADGRRRDIGAGDYVARGVVLAQIRHQDLKNHVDEANAAVNQAEAQYVDATQDYERAKALYATHSLTKPEYDRAQATFDSTLGAVNQAKAALHQAQLALDDADLTAPFSGYIIARSVELGNLAVPGMVAFTIADTSAVKVTFSVPDYAVRHLRLGQQFTVHVQDDTKDYKGKVTSIAASADEKNRVFPIEVTVPNPKSDLKPGMIASLNVTGLPKPPVPSVPLSAIVPNPSNPGQYAVFIATEQSGRWLATLRPVGLGETHDNGVGIDGVQPGEKVVVVGTAELKDGAPIQILP
ncbi:MAG TPA: efflux RND transporter periplasmic adaptor subunit [Terriglobales bacterium]|nr:efflux RND transporter periplasmic adaptor subunit [Terriglobales bacterium]